LRTVPALATIHHGNAQHDGTEAKTVLKLNGDWEEMVLIHHLGTSVGTGTVGNSAVTVTAIHLEKVCRLPCKTTVLTDGDYYVDAPGMRAARLQLPVGANALNLRVKGAPTWPITLSFVGALAGGSVAGASAYDVFGSSKPQSFSTITLIAGLSLLGVSLVGGLFLAPKTTIENAATRNAVSPSRPKPKSAWRLGPEGLQF
jgi:hypothetical protein